MFTLIRNAIREDNYQEFDRLLKEFETKALFKGLRLRRALSIVEFSLKYKKIDSAIRLYHAIHKYNIKSPEVLIGLAETYLAKKNNQKALFYYQQAIKLAEISGHKNLQKYREYFKKLRNQSL